MQLKQSKETKKQVISTAQIEQMTIWTQNLASGGNKDSQACF
jgi:hypothetical protein